MFLIKVGMAVVCRLIVPTQDPITTETSSPQEIVLRKGTVHDIIVEKDLKLIDNSFGIEEDRDVLIVKMEDGDLIKVRPTSCRPSLSKEAFQKYQESLRESQKDVENEAPDEVEVPSVQVKEEPSKTKEQDIEKTEPQKENPAPIDKADLLKQLEE